MDIKIVLICCLANLSLTASNHPQVYEKLNEFPQNEIVNIRTVRHPLDHIENKKQMKVYDAPQFNYNSAVQQDHLKNRYIQQQLSNLMAFQRLSKNVHITQPARVPQRDLTPKLKTLPVWKQFDPNTVKLRIPRNDPPTSSNSMEEEVNSLEKLYPSGRTEKNSTENDLAKASSTNRKRSNRKLKPSSYYVNEDLESEASEIIEEKRSINRQDHITPKSQLILINPNTLRQSFGLNQKVAQHIIENSTPKIVKTEQQLAALHDLIGKNPNVQLEGLKNLLQLAPQTNIILPPPRPFKVETPITENVIDIENPQERHNIQQPHVNTHGVVEHQFQLVEPTTANNYLQAPHPTLADIQAQLDVVSKQRTQEVLAQAHQQALAHVEAQHKAIAIAQANSEKAALEKVAAQNQVYGHRQTVPLKVNVVAVPVAVPVHPIITYSDQGLQYAPQHNHQSLPLIQAEKALQAQVQAQNEAILNDQARKEAAALAYAKAEKQRDAASLQKISITKTHSVMQGHQTPNAFQKVLLETQHQTEKLYPNQHAQEDELSDELQYAAKYAFGYRIKDIEHGNDYGHEEKREGKSAQGHYHVLLPDGRLQKVEYYADPSGYHAKVTYQNLAHH